MRSELVKQHYELEKRLAQRILTSTPPERSRVVRESYDELYRTIPWHPDLLGSPERARAAVRSGLGLYAQLIQPRSRVLEVGCGQGHLAAALAARDQSVFMCATDVSAVKLEGARDDGCDVRVLSSEGTCLPFGSGSFDLVLSSQVLEHLHPNDVRAHLAEVLRVLRRGGRYALDTPNGLTGPYDVSRGFDAVATGFHLKEWTYRELVALATQVGFARCRSDWPLWGAVARRLGLPGRAWHLTALAKVRCERLLERIAPARVREHLGRLMGVSAVFLVLEN